MIDWLRRFRPPRDKQRFAVLGPLRPGESAESRLVLTGLSARGVLLHNGPVPWEVGEQLRLTIRAREGAEISLWAVLQSRTENSARLTFTHALPPREVLATTAELFQAKTIVIESAELARGERKRA